MGRAYLQGAGLTTCLGGNLPDNLTALSAQPGGARPIELPLGGERIALPYHAIDEPAFDAGAQRVYTILERVVREAFDAAGLSAHEREAAAIFLGSSSFEMRVSEERYQRELETQGEGLPLRFTGFGRIVDWLRSSLGLRGESYVFNTACTSSANALLYASQMIEVGWIRHALVIGLEVFNATTVLGFYGLNLISPKGMRPFDAERSGLVLGEGCGALVLGPEAPSPDAFFLRGGANLCDIHSVTAANPDGSSITEVVRVALARAGLSCTEIRAIKAHGTASQLNDEAEAAGLLSVFGRVPPPIVALKPYIGHTLGACGVNELILFCGALAQGFLVTNPGICETAGDLGIALNQEAQPPPRGTFLLDYFGFAGSNTALLLCNESSAPFGGEGP